jgi:DNA-binding PadR family transcriptional regulator
VGKFELAVMATVIKLRDKAYGVSIQEELEKQLNKSVAEGQIYVTLGRMEAKGFLESEMGGATAERGGRAKKFYRLTGLGQKAMNEERTSLMGLMGLKTSWKGL